MYVKCILRCKHASTLFRTTSREECMADLLLQGSLITFFLLYFNRPGVKVQCKKINRLISTYNLVLAYLHDEIAVVLA